MGEITADYAALLAVQELDTRLDQLHHARESLPERAELAAVEAETAVLAGRRAEVEAVRDELGRRQKRADDELSTLEAKIAEQDKRLYGGEVTSPKDAMALQEELESLGRLRSDLEDRELEILVELEPVTEELDTIAASAAELAGREDAVRSKLTAAEAEIDVEISSITDERATAVAPVDDGLVEAYESRRRRLGGVGVAKLEGGRCLGCNLALSAVEVDRIKGLDPATRVDCEECGRILVR